MPRPLYTILHVVALSGLILMTTACDRVVASSNTAAAITKKSFENTRDTWLDVFTYHPPQVDQLPQTRYCYQMQTDVVCYDSPQNRLTAKLVGYQDGEHASWVQPGGGALGVSGGEPVTARVVAAAKTAHAETSAPVSAVTSKTIDVPQKGSIDASNLAPPVASKSGSKMADSNATN